jgi:RNA polymerase sigma factor CnrH
VSLDLSQCSDGELAALALGGQERAYREFLRRYREPIYRLVRNTIRDSEEALDVTQESFVSAFAALKRYDRERPFNLWISRIALNKCRDWGRRRAVRSFFTRAAPIDEVFDLASDAASPETEASDRAELRRVSAAIGELPAKLREALVLRAIEGMSQAEAAEALGVTEKAVETRLYRARGTLAELLGVDGVRGWKEF